MPNHYQQGADYCVNRIQRNHLQGYQIHIICIEMLLKLLSARTLSPRPDLAYVIYASRLELTFPRLKQRMIESNTFQWLLFYLIYSSRLRWNVFVHLFIFSMTNPQFDYHKSLSTNIERHIVRTTVSWSNPEWYVLKLFMINIKHNERGIQSKDGLIKICFIWNVLTWIWTEWKQNIQYSLDF